MGGNRKYPWVSETPGTEEACGRRNAVNVGCFAGSTFESHTPALRLSHTQQQRNGGLGDDAAMPPHTPTVQQLWHLFRRSSGEHGISVCSEGISRSARLIGSPVQTHVAVLGRNNKAAPTVLRLRQADYSQRVCVEGPTPRSTSHRTSHRTARHRPAPPRPAPPRHAPPRHAPRPAPPGPTTPRHPTPNNDLNPPAPKKTNSGRRPPWRGGWGRRWDRGGGPCIYMPRDDRHVEVDHRQQQATEREGMARYHIRDLPYHPDLEFAPAPTCWF